MNGINKVILIGHLGADPETRFLPSGGAVTNANLATSASWKDKQTGEQKEQTEWHRLVFYNRLGEIAGEYLKKGGQIYIEGQIRTRKWQGNDGQDRYTTEIIVRELRMLDKRPQTDANPAAAPPAQPPPRQPPPQQGQRQQAAPAPTDYDDDIPF